jgi:outer membrane protein TolC
MNSMHRSIRAAVRGARAAVIVRVGAVLGALSLAMVAGPHVAAAQDTASVPTRAITLGDAARLAARQGAPAEAARARVEQANARITQSRSALLPNLSAVASQTGRTFNTATFGISFPSAPGQRPLFDPNGQVEGPVNLLDMRAHLSQPLLDLSAIERVRSARAAADASNADATAQAQTAANTAATSYLRVLRADAQYEARVADSALAADLLGIARDQLQAGVGVALDVTRAQSQLAGARAQLIAARNDRNRSRLELQRAIGLPLDAPVQLADTLGRLAVADSLPSEGAAIDRAMSHRADLRAATAQLVASQRQITALRAERLPTVGLVADQGSIGKSPAHLLPTYDWGVQVSMPIFDGFRREGRVQEQQAVSREVDVRLRDLRQQTAVEVRSSLLDLRSAREQVDAARERLQLAEQELAQARERFRAGVAGNADVISAQLSLNTARTQFVDVLAGYQTARVALARAQGDVTALP